MSWLKRLLLFFPPLYFLAYRVRYQLEIKKAKELIIVTTPGHVGSSTVYNTLKTIMWPEGTYLYDIHSLNERFNNSSSVPSISARHVLQEVLRKTLLKNQLRDKKVTIITVVRDPVARALGGMFQNSDVFIKGVKVSDLQKKDFVIEKQNVYKQLMEEGLLESTANWQLEFYKKELKEYWGFDWSELKGGQRVTHHNNFTFIVFTLEDLAVEMTQTSNELWGYNLKLKMTNRNDNEFYAYCKKEMKFDPNVLNTLYEDQFLRRIYGESRLSELAAKWMVPQ